MSQSTEHNLNRIITKAAALFGGVQVVSILCSVIRTKVIAILLGSTGIGIIGLDNRAIERKRLFKEYNEEIGRLMARGFDDIYLVKSEATKYLEEGLKIENKEYYLCEKFHGGICSDGGCGRNGYNQNFKRFPSWNL